MPHARRTSSALCWQRVGAQVYPQAIHRVTHSLAAGAPTAHPQTQCEAPGLLPSAFPLRMAPDRGLRRPDVRRPNSRRQRCVDARHPGLWTELWARWGRRGVFLWTGRDRGVHARIVPGRTSRATCADGDRHCGRERNRVAEVFGTGLVGCGSVPVHGVVQVSHTGGTVPAWLILWVR